VSAENLQIIRELVEAFNGRDLDAAFAVLHPEAELHPLRAQLEGKAYVGHDGLRELLADFDQDWEYVQMDPEEFREADDKVLVLGRLRARARASGMDLDVPMGFVWTLREGKVVHGRTFSDQADAVRAAGLV
jgi:ketosteroid isomerase-like protein